MGMGMSIRGNERNGNLKKNILADRLSARELWTNPALTVLLQVEQLHWSQLTHRCYWNKALDTMVNLNV